MKIKFLRIISSVLTAVTILALFSTAVFAADFTTLIAIDGEVTLDGTNPGTVTVYWRSTGDQNIYAIEGDWSVKELESTNYLTLTEITSDVITFSGFYYTDPETGKVRWLDDSFENPGVLSDGKNLLSATYEIAADTPAGTYTVQYASVVLVGDDYENDKAPVKPSPKIVVKRSSTPSDPAKPTINVTGTYTYTGSNITATVTGYNSATMNITGNVGKNAGNYTVSVTSKTGKWADGSTAAVTKNWTIAKADPSVTAPTGLTGTKGKALSTVTLPTGWAWKAPTTVMNTLGNQTFAAVYTPADTTNYNTKEANLTVNVSEPPVTNPAKPTINVTGTYTYTGSNITATVTGYNSATMNITGNVGKNAGNYTVSVTSKTGKWADGSTAAVTKNWTIAKATPTGMPAFTPIVAAGQTLADASLTANFNIPGSIKWIAEDGSELAGTTTVEQNVYYKWQFTPTDADNYEILTGTIRLYSNSTGGGGIAVIWHTVKFDTNGGTAIANKPVIRNTKLAMPTAPTKDGYVFDGWYTDKELKIAYNFDTKVTKNFTLYAKWVKPAAPEWKNPFTDVKTSDWFYGNVKYASENGLMSGTTNTTFAPNKPLTRGMLVMVLYRADGEPAVNKSMPFADVDANAYYANAVIWAHQNGIVNGVTENTFAPDNNITREQIATIMYRYAKYKGFDVSAGENTNIMSYTDAENVSEYAISAMQYAVGSGLMKGKTESTINPLDNATRAEIAAILQRFFEANK